MPKELPLSLGMIALVDDEDFDAVSGRKWYMRSNGYAASNLGGGRVVYLHRRLMDPERGLDVDHINGDRLDCRRTNLRVCTRSENRRNHSGRWETNSKFRGVFKRFVRPGWFVILTAPGRQLYLGDYPEEEKAARAYDAGARFYLGERAKVNFDGAERLSARDLLLRNGQAKARTSKYRGVYGRQGRWEVSIVVGEKHRYVGTFDDELEAAVAYDEAALRLGVADRLNFPAAA